MDDESLKAALMKIPDTFQLNVRAVKDDMERLLASATVADQQKYIKSLATTAEETVDNKAVASIMSFIFLSVDPKNQIKKTVTRILLGMDSQLVANAMSDQIVSIIMKVEQDKTRNVDEDNVVICNLSTCFNNFPPGIEGLSYVFKVVYNFAYNNFIKLVALLRSKPQEDSIPTFVYNTSKFLVAFLSQCHTSEDVPETSLRLLTACSVVIDNDKVNFNTKLNCGMLVSHAALISSIGNSEENNTKVLASIANLLQLDADRSAAQRTKTITARICVFSGMLNTFPHEIICADTLSDEPAPVYIFRTFLESASKCTGQPGEILEISRAFISLSKLLYSMEVSSITMIFTSILDYIWTHLDHFLEPVRQDTKEVLKNVAKVAMIHEREGDAQLINNIIDYLSTTFKKSNANFKAVTLVSNETTCNYLLSIFPDLPNILLDSMKNSSLCQQVGSSYEKLMEQNSKEDPLGWINTWVKMLVPLLQTTDDMLHFALKKIFTTAFKLNHDVLKLLSHGQLKFDNPRELSVMLSCFVLARKTSSKMSLYSEDSETLWNGMIKCDFLELLMADQNPEIRIASLTLIVESQKTTEIFPEWDLKFLVRFLHYNITSQLPHVRQQVLALYKKALTRYKDSLYVIERHIKNLKNKSIVLRNLDFDFQRVELDKQQKYYKNFLLELFEDELMKGLCADVNYPRRSVSLELLWFLSECIKDDVFLKLWTKDHVDMLFQVLYDSYESNIKMATKLLMALPKSLVFGETNSEFSVKLKASLMLGASLKPTSTVTAAYQIQVLMESPHAKAVVKELVATFDLELAANTDASVTTLLIHHLINEIEIGLQVANNNVIIAAKYAPIYGLIFAIRHLITKHNYTKQHPEIVPTLIELCMKISEVALPIVNNSSPEGFMPSDDADEITDETVTSQMILVYAWRATKEVSLLLGELKIDSLLEQSRYLSQVADYFINLFMETKHRGAYEQASVGFSKFCSKLWKAEGHFAWWPVKWLEINLDVVKGTTDFSNVCATRRSAGLPFMVQGILTTEPPTRMNESFHHCMTTLLDIAENFSAENEVGATHSMNILRALYKHNMLGELVTPYVGRGVKIAIVRFRHPVWGVRNAATLMFSALMMRMFGVQRTKDNEELSIKNRLSARVFFMRYPELYDFILDKLKEYTRDTCDTVSLYPLLFILSRLFSSGDKHEMLKYLPFIEKCLKNSIMQMRQLAAQASIATIPIEDYVVYVTKLLEEIKEKLPGNVLHGKLIQLNLLVKNMSPLVNFDVPPLIMGSFWIIQEAGITVPYLNATIYMEILILFVTKFKQKCFGRPEFKNLMYEVLKLPDASNERFKLPLDKPFMLTRLSLFLHVFANILDITSCNREKYIKIMLMTALHDPHEDLQIYALNCLNFLFTNSFFKKYNFHPTDQEEDTEVALESALIKPMNEEMKMRIASSITADLGCYNLFTDIFYILLKRSRRYAYRVCKILPYFPCIINGFRPKTIPIALNSQTVLEFLICECTRLGDEMVCAIVPILSTLAFESKQKLNYKNLVKNILKRYSDVDNTVDQRLAVCNFLVQNSKFLYDLETIQLGDVIEVWYIVLNLLQDPEIVVRDRISKITNFIQWPISSFIRRFILGMYVISEKSLEELLFYMPGMIPYEEAMQIYLHLIVSDSKALTESEIFDIGELNTYRENEVMSVKATKYLKKYLWILEDGLNYEDRSIFFEEHIQLVSSKLLNLLQGQQKSELQRLGVTILYDVISFVEARTIPKMNFEKEFNDFVDEKCQSIVRGTNNKSVANFFRILFTKDS